MCPVNVVCGLKLDFCEVEYAMFMISIQFHVGDFLLVFFGSYCFPNIFGVLAKQKQGPFDVRCFGSVLGLPVISCG
jgi:hypothetical protein